MCLERTSVLFISYEEDRIKRWLIDWLKMRTDKRLDRIKDLALKTGGTENTCLSKPSASYHFNLNVSVLSLTLNPLSSEAYSCVCLLLPLPLMRAANPAQLLITKKGKKKKKVFIDLFWAVVLSWTKMDASWQSWVKVSLYHWRSFSSSSSSPPQQLSLFSIWLAWI